jgi:hypothetical protein
MNINLKHNEKIIHELHPESSLLFLKKLPLTLLISISLIGTSQALTFFNNNSNNDLYGRTLSSTGIPDKWTNLESPLVDINIPKDWKLINDYNKYREITSRNENIRMTGPLNNPSKSDCMHILNNFQRYSGGNIGVNFNGITLKDCLFDLRARLYEGDQNYVLKLFERWAAEDGLTQPKDMEPGSKDYDYFRTISMISGIYAQEKDHIKFSNTVKVWLADVLLNTQFRSFGGGGFRKRCLDPYLKPQIWGNDCSTPRFIYTEAMLVGGLALNNKEIFDEGIDSLQYITTLFDDKNIYSPWATRGIRAMGYHNQIPTWFSHFAVILDTVGYDLMEHEMPNGSKVHEVIKFSFDHVWEDDLSLFWPYIKMDRGTNFDKTYRELLKPLSERIYSPGNNGHPAKPQKVVRSSIRYVEKYQPELKEEFGYEEIYTRFVSGTRDFSDAYSYHSTPGDCSYCRVDEYGMYHVDSAFDMHSIYKASGKVFLTE